MQFLPVEAENFALLLWESREPLYCKYSKVASHYSQLFPSCSKQNTIILRVGLQQNSWQCMRPQHVLLWLQGPQDTELMISQCAGREELYQNQPIWV